MNGYLKYIIEDRKRSHKEGYDEAKFEWHNNIIDLMRWCHEQAELHKDNIEVYIAYERMFDHVNEVLDGDYK